MSTFIRISNMIVIISILIGLGQIRRSASLTSNPRMTSVFVSDEQINEASGLAASRKHPGCFWTHNDSGDKARIFLIDSQGSTVAQVIFPGIKNRDWEDIATGPGPIDGESYIYIGEIGDNVGRYDFKRIYRIIEPGSIDKKRITVAQIEVLTFRYPDHNRDAETLMIDSQSKDLFIVSKREQGVHVYQAAFPYSLTDTLTLKKIGTLPITKVTGGDMSADGSHILVKTYSSIYYWSRKSGESVKQALSREPKQIYYLTEPQGEGVAWSLDGSSYLTISEANLLRTPLLICYKFTQ